MSGTLYVVATPIGNLEDVSLRALRILREVSLIAAEDTRRTGRLLQHYSISTPTTSLHEHNEREKAPRLVGALLEGRSIALVSDAGTPLVSDPGRGLVRAAREAGIRIETIPGPSAVTALMAAVGLSDGTFSFLGFPPIKAIDRTQWLLDASGRREAVVFFEAPHRIERTIGELTKFVGPERLVAIGRELTKAHEEIVVCPISQALGRLASLKGEFTIALTPSKSTPEVVLLPDAAELARELGRLIENGAASKREALKSLAARYGVSVNQLYRLVDEPRS